MEYEIGIFYYFNIFKKNYKMILFLIVLAAFFGFLSGIIKKPSYTSRCSILLTESSGTTTSAFGRFLGLPELSFSSSSANTIISIVKSRRMLDDIYSNFKELSRISNFKLKLEAFDTKQGTLIIEVKGREPKLVSEIANFCIKNLDVINAELNITPQRPMVKVLDPAIPATRPDPRHILKRIAIAAIFAFFIAVLFAFGAEYFKTWTSIKK